MLVIPNNLFKKFDKQVEKNFLKKNKGSRTEWVNLTHVKVKKQDSYVVCGANEACNVSRVFRVLHACIL